MHPFGPCRLHVAHFGFDSSACNRLGFGIVMFNFAAVVDAVGYRYSLVGCSFSMVAMGAAACMGCGPLRRHCGEEYRGAARSEQYGECPTFQHSRARLHM